MRTSTSISTRLVGLCALLAAVGADAACSNNTGTVFDACLSCGPDGGNHPAAVIIPGGGVGSGAINGQVNLYVIDDDTRLPIVGATVRVGADNGTTDATGLFTANDTALMGAQTIAIKAANYEGALWIGANGANITIDLKPSVVPVPTQANLSGTIAGFSGITVATGHTVVASVTYSQDDQLEDTANNLTTSGSANECSSALSPSCAFTVTTRTGHVALVAAIFDHDTTANTNSLIKWAYLGGLVVANGIAQTGLSLALVDAGNLVDQTVDLGSPPAGLPNVAGVVGIELPTDGLVQLPVLFSAASPTALLPALAAFPAGADYRLTGLANDGTGPTDAASVVLRHPLTASPLAAGTWLDSPTELSVSATSASWAAVTGAQVYTLGYKTATARLLAVTTFDGSTSVTIPDLLQLAATSQLTATVGALAAKLTLTDFALDTDREKLTGESAQPVTVGS